MAVTGTPVDANRPESPRLGLVGTQRAYFGAARLEALGAVHGTVGPRRERNLPGAAAVAANDVVHALRPRRGALGFRATSAIGAALRLVEQALLRVELLLAGGPDEAISALAAAEAFVGEGHRHLALPGGRKC